jgi:putative membrane protein
MVEQVRQGTPGLDRATELAFARTRAAYERTMMAWIRTAISLISFGFGIYKFFQLDLPRRDQHAHLIGPREFAVMLVSIGLLSLLIGTVEYRQQIKTLRMESSDDRRSLAVLLAALLALLGLLALFVVLFRE